MMKLTRRGFFGAAGASVVATAILPVVAAKAAADADDEWGVYDDSFLGRTWQGCYVEPNAADHDRALVDAINEDLARLREHGMIA